MVDIEEYVSEQGINFELIFNKVPQITNLGREKAEIFFNLLERQKNGNLTWM